MTVGITFSTPIDSPTHLDFPTHLGQLTPGWLTDRLREQRVMSSEAQVTAITSTPVGVGAGMMSNVSRIRLTYSAATDAPVSLIAKFTTADEGNRAIGVACSIYEREIKFFDTIGRSRLVATPICYAGEYDPQTGFSVLLLEDLESYEPGDQIIGCTAKEAEQIIDAVLPLHATYWGVERAPELAWLWSIDHESQIAGITAACAGGWDACVAGFGDYMSEELKAVRDRYLAAMPELHRKLARGPQTIVHGDLRLDNLMLSARPEQPPVVLLDWQAMLTSNGLQDIAYLLSQSVTTDERREHEGELLKYYRSRLAEQGISSLTLEDCWAGYRLGALYTLSYAILTCGSLGPTDDRSRRFMQAMIGRASSAVTEIGALTLLDGR